jgi:hypothetical protein
LLGAGQGLLRRLAALLGTLLGSWWHVGSAKTTDLLSKGILNSQAVCIRTRHRV